jgi:hypothetical protein
MPIKTLFERDPHQRASSDLHVYWNEGGTLEGRDEVIPLDGGYRSWPGFRRRSCYSPGLAGRPASNGTIYAFSF